jgi:hypothetical protein
VKVVAQRSVPAAAAPPPWVQELTSPPLADTSAPDGVVGGVEHPRALPRNQRASDRAVGQGIHHCFQLRVLPCLRPHQEGRGGARHRIAEVKQVWAVAGLHTRVVVCAPRQRHSHKEQEDGGQQGGAGTRQEQEDAKEGGANGCMPCRWSLILGELTDGSLRLEGDCCCWRRRERQWERLRPARALAASAAAPCLHRLPTSPRQRRLERQRLEGLLDALKEPGEHDIQPRRSEAVVEARRPHRGNRAHGFGSRVAVRPWPLPQEW